jgi:hypothetical protein
MVLPAAVAFSLGAGAASIALEAAPRSNSTELQILDLVVRNHGLRDAGTALEVRARNQAPDPTDFDLSIRPTKAAVLQGCFPYESRRRPRVVKTRFTVKQLQLHGGDTDRFTVDIRIPGVGNPFGPYGELAVVLETIDVSVVDSARRVIAHETVVASIPGVPSDELRFFFGTRSTLRDETLNWDGARTLTDLRPGMLRCFRRNRNAAIDLLRRPGMRSSELRALADIIPRLPSLDVG